VVGVVGVGTQNTSSSHARGRKDVFFVNTSLNTIEKDKNSEYSPRADSNSPTLPTSPTTPVTLGVDLETCGAGRGDALSLWKGEIRLVSLADSEGVITQYDLKGASLPVEVATSITSSVLVIHNALFDLPFLAAKLGLWPEGVFCTLTASRLLEHLKTTRHELKDALGRHLGVSLPKEHGASDWGGALTGPQMEYARDDVRYLLRLADTLATKLKERGLVDVFALEMALIPVVMRMELHGFAVDAGKLRGIMEEQTALASDLQGRLKAAFNCPDFNPGSPDQVKKAFEKEGIFLQKTEEEVLCTIDDPRAQGILDCRGAKKLAGVAEGLLEKVRGGRIHAKFNSLGAVTGRFSSSKPNLQNVPRGVMRSCFIASAPDRRLVVADYSQIELRVAALVAGETAMIEAFKQGEDLHYKIAAANLRKPIEEVSKAERNTVGKSTNFGFIYGQGAKGFRTYARTGYGLELTLSEAWEFRNTFFIMYPAIAQWHRDCWGKAEAGVKEARTVLGRLLLPQSGKTWSRFNMLTEYVVSGSCADLLKLAMVKIDSVAPSDVHLVATVHDELVYDVPTDLAGKSLGMIRGVMEEAFAEMFGGDVPVEVEAKVCSNWGEK
jgi:DNA polymerase I